MKGEWKITRNYVGGEYCYAVYRLIDVNAVDHSGNREFVTGYLDSREEAQAVLDTLENY